MQGLKIIFADRVRSAPPRQLLRRLLGQALHEARRRCHQGACC